MTNWLTSSLLPPEILFSELPLEVARCCMAFEIFPAVESDIFSDIVQTNNPALTLFWKDLKQNVSAVFEIPLSELKNYQLKATQTLNYSI